MPSKTKAVAKTKTNQPATFDTSLSTGLENTDSSDLVIPQIVLLQPLSPEVNDGATPGKFYHKTLKESYDSLRVLPCHWEKCLTKWKPRDEGGGFLGKFSINEKQGLRSDDGGRTFYDDEGLYKETHYYTCLYEHDGLLDPVVISMYGTAIFISKSWISMMKQMRNNAGNPLPMYAHFYRIDPIKKSNNMGTWWSYNINPDGRVESQDEVDQAEGLVRMMSSGQAVVDQPTDTEKETNVV